MIEPNEPESNGNASRGRDAVAPRWTNRGEIFGRLTRLALKELRETLRDRRTIVTLVVMPLVLYPLLALVFQRFLVTSLTSQGVVEYVIGVDSTHTRMQLEEHLRAGEALLQRQDVADTTRDASIDDASTKLAKQLLEPEIKIGELPSRDVAERCVIDAVVHLAIMPRLGAAEADGDGLDRPQAWEIFYRSGSPASEAALRYVEQRLHAYGEAQLDLQLRELGVAADLPATSQRHALDFSGAPVFSLAALIPLILVLMTVTGAVYPAIDLTAGERERGTLEMLIAAPVPRLGLLLAKYVAVLAVALLTALVNLTGMAITSHSTGLNTSLFGGAGLSLPVVINVLLLLGLFAAFFSAVLLAITSCARSFKEAQAYIIPLMLLCLVPGVICLMPTLQFSGPLAVVPLVNIVLLARDLLEGSVVPLYATVAVISTLFYVLAALGLAARVFGTDAILYGSQSTWADVFRRPREQRAAMSPSAAAFALAAMFPTYFVLAATLAQSREMSFLMRLFVGAMITALVFCGIPWGIALFHRVRAASGLGFVRPKFSSLIAAGLLGLVLWPAAHELFLVNEQIGINSVRLDQLSEVKALLDQLQHVPLVWVILALAVVPGVCEEFFFRGALFSSLRSVTSPWRTIVGAAVIFGLFHVIAGTMLAPERFLPSAFLGLVLGWVRLRTGSVLPCMLLHALHNGLILSVVHWQNELAARGFGIEEATHLPATWLVSAGVGTLVAIAWMILATRPSDRGLAAGASAT
jgi:ABC-2 type transport system permease protein/sodium transport system permease protein